MNDIASAPVMRGASPSPKKAAYQYDATQPSGLQKRKKAFLSQSLEDEWLKRDPDVASMCRPNRGRGIRRGAGG
jgi:hypothetical protein